MQEVYYFHLAYGTQNKVYDLNGDGWVTVSDWLEFISTHEWLWS